MLNVIEPGTIDDLVTDAERMGESVTPRMIRAWTAAGLLDAPTRRPAGKGHGSLPALYSPAQRELFVTLLHHRHNNGIRSLARIPVFVWMYWGEGHVPLRQVRIALTTWLDDATTSKKVARQTAQELLAHLTHPQATHAARTRLRDVLAQVAYAGGRGADFDQLEQAVRAVFEPGHGQVRRAIGHPEAALMAETTVHLLRARLTALALLRNSAITDDDFRDARHAHLLTFAEYAAKHPTLAAATPEDQPNLYAPLNPELALAQCCGNLLTTLGVQAMHPDVANRVRRAPAPPTQPWL
ncbi:hypothetical protein JCM33774_46250 [Actinophytocola sp. KF-1]